jgi:hypothetical protein
MHPYARKRRFGRPFRSITVLRSLVAEGMNMIVVTVNLLMDKSVAFSVAQ